MVSPISFTCLIFLFIIIVSQSHSFSAVVFNSFFYALLPLFSPQEACAKYWPDEVGKSTPFGTFNVELISEQNLDHYIIREMKMTEINAVSDQPRNETVLLRILLSDKLVVSPKGPWERRTQNGKWSFGRNEKKRTCKSLTPNQIPNPNH